MPPVLLNPYVLGAAAPPPSWAAQVASLSPKWWHRLSTAPGGMLDSSGNSRDGYYETVTAATGLVVGDSDGAKTFGTNSRALVPYGSWMTATSFTVSAVINPASFAATNGLIGRYAHDFSNSHFFFRLDGNKLALYIFSGGALSVATGATSLVAGTTYDVAASWDGLNMKVLLNGVVDGTATRGAIGGGAYALHIGKDISNDEPFNGVIDEVAYFVNQVLTPTELAAFRTARLAGSGTYPATVLAKSPSGYWRLGDSLAYTDASGNGYTVGGTGGLVGGQASLIPNDLVDKATLFTNGSVYTTYASGLNVPNHTAVATFKVAATSGNQTIIARHGGSPTQFLMRLEGNVLRYYIQNGGTYIGLGTSTVVAGTAYQAACSYDGATMRLYKNGVLVNSVAQVGINSDTVSPLTVGSSYAGSAFGEYFNGVIDEALLFDSRLSDANIAALATAAGF